MRDTYSGILLRLPHNKVYSRKKVTADLLNHNSNEAAIFTKQNLQPAWWQLIDKSGFFEDKI